MAEQPPTAPPSSSSTVAAKTDEEKEEMLDRMLTRLALCDDSKLQALLSKLLPLTLSSLSSQSPPVRNKVLEILSHVNKRVKHQPEIGLPLLELWNLYAEANASPMVRNFCIVYIEMAFNRVDVKEKESMAPMLLANISKVPHQHKDIMLRIMAKVIGECHASQIDEKVALKYKPLGTSEDREMFLEFCLQFMLYQQPPQAGTSPPGLSIDQTNRITGNQPLNNNVLLIRKLGLLNVIEAMELSAELVYPLYLVATSDSQEPVIKRGEELLKKKAFGANLDDPHLVKKLLLLFNGTSSVESVAPESRINPASAALKVKLMSLFCRSITATNSFPGTLQCIFGCMYGNSTTPRLKQLGMEFTVWVFKHATIDQLKLMGPIILNGILKLLDGYPNYESDAIARDTKAFCYQAIGLLSHRLPHLFRDKIDMAVRLFDALKAETQSFRAVIQEATNSLADAYKGAPAAVLRDLETILLNNCQVEQDEVRFCALRWTTALFHVQHCPSRYICMLAVADSRLDIREMAFQGLVLDKDVGGTASQNPDIHYPGLGNMLEYILSQQPKLLDSSETRNQNLVFDSRVYVAMIKFLSKCFDSEFAENNSLSTSSEFLSSMRTMCSLLEHAMSYEGSVELHATASKILLSIGSHLPELISSHYGHRISWLKQLLSHIDTDTREYVARLLGIACLALPVSASCDLIGDLLSSASGAKNLRFEAYHGALSAIGYVTADVMSKLTHIPESLFQNVLKCLVDVVNSENSALASVAMQALGHIGLRVALPPLADNSDSVDVLVKLREKLSKLFSGDDTKAIQKIVISLGHMCMNETSPSNLNIALDLIFGLCRSKVEDILFAAGEALSFLWGGVPVTADVILKTSYSSLTTSSNFLLSDKNLSFHDYNLGSRTETDETYHSTVIDVISRKLFDDLLYSSRKEERCAGTVWLVSLSMYCGRHPVIQRMLPQIQEAFSHLLGEQNELTQELASQGLSIVYELGDESAKKKLVDALVSTFTGSGKRKRAVKLVDDSEVFQEGAMGESLTGGKLTTYKELCNLANEMGQPDLIFKFMDLANHQTSLNSKRGAAFGFSKIAKQAGDALQPHLQQLIPRLVRYQYDPDKNVQDAMAHIWKSLVAEPKKAIDQHWDVIIDDLTTQCESRLWRSREASCLALADIIQGRKFDEVKKHLNKLWTAAFRAMDDIKETVRNAGDKLCRSVTSLTIRLCDISLTEPSDAGKAMEIVLPLLLSEGILSKVDHIRVASIGVVMKLAKGAGIALRPHLPDLVCCMLESLSSLEDQRLNYVELHAANAGIQTEKLENLRISVAKGSPMWETLDICMNVLNSESLDLLVPRLAQLIRSGVGLNTRVGVASFISLLVQKVGSDIKPFTNMLLRLLFPVVKEERSSAVKRAFANSCGLVLNYAAPSQVQKLIEDTAALHTGVMNEQISCALLLKSYSSMASEVFGGYYAVIIPVIFISRFEDDKYVSGLFEELWENNTGGERITIQLYLGEIVSLVCDGLASSSWARKRKSANAICKLSEVLADSLFSFQHVLLESLMKEIPGRLWEGKDALLNAIGAVSASCHKAISSENPAMPNAILSMLSSACTKNAKKYREAALTSLDQVIKAFANPEFFNATFPLLFEMCKSAPVKKSGLASTTNDADSTEAADSSAPLEKVVSCITSCMHVALVTDILQQESNLMDVISITLSPELQWTVKMSAFSMIMELCLRLQNVLDESGGNLLNDSMTTFIVTLFQSLPPKIIDCIRTVKINQVHIMASECLWEIMKLCQRIQSADRTDFGFKADLIHQYEVEKNEEAKSNLKRSIDLIEELERKQFTCVTDQN